MIRLAQDLHHLLFRKPRLLHRSSGFRRSHLLKTQLVRISPSRSAPVESFFSLLKRERIRRRIYLTKDAARADVFDYIEMFYNPKRRHGSSGDLSPVEFERRYAKRGS